MTTTDSGRKLDGSPTVAVTGAAGYIGSRVLHLFQQERPDWELIALDNHFRGQVDRVGDVDINYGDIRDRKRLEEQLAGADVVIHLAALSGVDDCADNPDLAYEVNVTGTNNVAWFCRQTGAAMAFPFSMAVIGDPESFPITADMPRDPLNWYGRTKLLNERAIETLADGAFPAYLFLKSNLYGDHIVGDTVVTKSTVINFFVKRAVTNETLTVYEPGTQSRNFLHVSDVARLYLDSTSVLLDELSEESTGATTYEVASEEDPSVLEVAEFVAAAAGDILGHTPEVTLVENPRPDETNVKSFTVDTTHVRKDLGWTAEHTVEETIRDLLRRHA